MRRSLCSAPSASVDPVRLATLNLLHGRSLSDGAVRAADLKESAAELDADVLGLQEVDRGQPRSDGVDQTAVVAAASGAVSWRFEPALVGTPGRPGGRAATDGLHSDETRPDPGSVPGGAEPAYGIGLASRWPVREWRVRRFDPAPVPMPLMVPGQPGLTRVDDEPRVALAAVVESPSGPLTVVTTHLSFVPGWNVAQLRALTRWSADLPGPRFLLGDLNLPGSVPRLVTGWASLARVATYPSRRPRVQFDHVLAESARTVRVRSVHTRALPVSDHCGLVVDVDLR
jgi:endonuclease/exonuclease/phosphatase family metal-dependent hydrolase